MEILETIRKASKTYRKTDLIDCRAMKVGQWTAQGDVQIEKVRAFDASKLKPFGTQQVVPGNTKGSRHVFDERARLYVDPSKGTELDGPLCYIETESVLLHPEHRHQLFGPGHYRITYQRDFAMEEIRRVQD